MEVNFSNVLRCVFNRKFPTHKRQSYHFCPLHQKKACLFIFTLTEFLTLPATSPMNPHYLFFFQLERHLSGSHWHTSPLCLCAECSICSICLHKCSFFGSPRALDRYLSASVQIFSDKSQILIFLKNLLNWKLNYRPNSRTILKTNYYLKCSFDERKKKTGTKNTLLSKVIIQNKKEKESSKERKVKGVYHH